jgi:hypothetical protein
LKDYEKRKIVFWYDRDKTARDQEKLVPGEELDEIIQILKKNDIKFHILENNYFETKKLLETLISSSIRPNLKTSEFRTSRVNLRSMDMNWTISSLNTRNSLETRKRDLSL